MNTPSTPPLIAHRGIRSVGLENTLSAFRSAVENPPMGLIGVELDVHSTIDGEIVVHHDPVLPSGLVIAESLLDEISEERLDDGSAVPTLAEALDVLGDLRVFVETKGLDQIADEELFRLLRKGPSPAGYQIHSFDHRIIARLARMAAASDFTLGVLSCSWPVEPELQAIRAGARVLWQQWELIDVELMDRCQDNGIEVIAWTVPEEMIDWMMELGVAGVCTEL
ncbi:MAG TPA: glycerophosphodiester phosphodiesterase [Gemmatimonadales bacterium]|nr:glycerophosphodiester phosphodiesterase [Gemmatimonadales bacterium]